MSWKNIKIEKIASIEKVVGEYEINEIEKTPWGKFRIKVLEKQDGTYVAITNLMFIDEVGFENAGYGEGSTEEEALEKAISNFLALLPDDKQLSSDNFTVADPYDF